MKSEFIKFKELIDNAKSIAIFWHNNPDWDCLWSCFGLWSILKKLWKNVRYFANKSASKIYDFLWSENIFEPWFKWGDFDIIIMCDFFDPDVRFNDYYNIDEWYYKKLPKVIIDHHIRETVYGEIYIWWEHFSSTCEIVFGIVDELWLDLMDSKIATYLMTWLISDTGNFVFDCTSPRTYEVASKLLTYWANHQAIIKNIFMNNTFEYIKFQSLILDRLVIEWNLMYSYYSYDEMFSYWLDEDQSKAVLWALQSIRWDNIILLFRFTDEWISWSVRSNYDISNKIAWIFWGWGHAKASWFKIKWNNLWLKDIELIIQRIKEYLEKN